MELGEGGEWDEVLGSQWAVAGGGGGRGISMAQAELRLGDGVVGRRGVG